MDADEELRSFSAKLEGSQKMWPRTPWGTATLLIGTAHARGDDYPEARRWWKMTRSAGFTGAARDRLDELDRPQTDRNYPWYFSARDVLPRKISERLMETEIPEESDDPAAWVRPTLETFPELAQCGPYLLSHGDDTGRFLGLAILDNTKDLEMAREAAEMLDRNVTRKNRRGQIFRVLESLGPSEMPERNDTLYVRGYEISYEPVSTFSPEIQDLCDQAHHHLVNEEPDQAEPLLLQALRMEDAPSIRQNLGVAYQNQGKTEAARTLLEETREKYPDYAFARFAEATWLAAQGRAAEAHSLLQPIVRRSAFHVSEFTSLCEAMCTILIREDKFDEAGVWLDMWREIVPDDERQERFALLEGYRAMSQMMKKIGKRRKSRKEKHRRSG